MNARAKTPDRLEKLGYKPVSARKPLVELDSRGRAMLELMVYGSPDIEMCARIGREVNEPLSVEEAGDLVQLKRKNARWIFAQPIFQRELNRELELKRSGAKAAALDVTIALVHDRGEGTAADRTVQLKAAKEILGDAIGSPQQSPHLNLTVNTGAHITAGLVIRLPASTPAPPLELNAVEGEPGAHRLQTDPETMAQRFIANGETESRDDAE